MEQSSERLTGSLSQNPVMIDSPDMVKKKTKICSKTPQTNQTFNDFNRTKFASYSDLSNLGGETRTIKKSLEKIDAQFMKHKNFSPKKIGLAGDDSMSKTKMEDKLSKISQEDDEDIEDGMMIQPPKFDKKKSSIY